MKPAADSEKRSSRRLCETLSPRPQMPKLVVSVLFALFAYLVPAFSEVTAVAVAFLAAVVLYTAFMMRSVGAIVAVSVGTMILFLTFGTAPAALILAVTTGNAVVSWLLTSFRRPTAYGALAIPLLAVLLTLLLPGDHSVLPVLLMLPVLALLCVSAIPTLSRGVATCITAGGYLVSALLLLLVCLQKNGEISFAAVGTLLDQLQEDALQSALLLRDQLIALWEETAAKENGEAFRKAAETLKNTLNETVLRDVISSAFRILPGTILGLSSVLGYLTHTYLLLCYGACGWRSAIPQQMSTLRMSGVSALLYCTALFVTFFATPEDLFGALCWNLFLMLLPAFLLLGAGTLLGKVRAARGGGRFFLLSGTLFLLCCIGMETFRLLSLIGAFAVLLGILRRKGNTDPDDNGNQT